MKVILAGLMLLAGTAAAQGDFWCFAPLKYAPVPGKPSVPMQADSERNAVPDATWMTAQVTAVPVVNMAKWGGCIWHCRTTGTVPSGNLIWQVQGVPTVAQIADTLASSQLFRLIAAAILKSIIDSHKFAD